jgi:putative tetraheme cytochrome c
MLEQKIDVKKIFKDEYKPTKEEKEFLKQKADKNNTKPVDG